MENVGPRGVILHSSFILHRSSLEAKMGGERDLRKRTKDFALRVIRLYGSLPTTTEAQVMGKQVLRSGTSIGAHYCEATRARSTAEFISKMEGGLQELDETGYWLEILGDADIVTAQRLKPLLDEVEELIAVFVTMVKKVKNKR
jgi:four helix bundle protein